MMMIPSQAESDSAFTVTIGGVDLCLTPSPGLSIDDASAMLVSLSSYSNGEVLIDLNGFVGTLALRTKKNHTSSTNKYVDDESIEASTTPTSKLIDNTVPDPDGLERYLEDLIRGFLIDYGGNTHNGSCLLGRKLAASRGYHDASKSALQELKETFGSLSKFMKVHQDMFVIIEAVNKADNIVSLSGNKRASSPHPLLKRCDTLLTQASDNN